jgi:hypothetical protein
MFVLIEICHVHFDQHSSLHGNINNLKLELKMIENFNGLSRFLILL